VKSCSFRRLVLARPVNKASSGLPKTPHASAVYMRMCVCVSVGVCVEWTLLVLSVDGGQSGGHACSQQPASQYGCVHR
jgi:hypothetical protein